MPFILFKILPKYIIEKNYLDILLIFYGLTLDAMLILEKEKTLYLYVWWLQGIKNVELIYIQDVEFIYIEDIEDILKKYPTM